ncbi:hypothetical protein QQ020_06685 [Fulvivirgaceae bacterium BMA12]|uniref:DUF3311 domain-containing protein n=1 Tax=Agaribacillus aureus TaxID=3051825 RepID=A0ABT8L3W6_9BACT|nr:hypothetical protein [Fulvivirgaceae bacterium BMA12]
MNKSLYWIICRIAALMLVVITFTPLVMPAGTHGPALWGMPYTLWTGIIVSILLVLLTFIGTRIHPGRKNSEEQ